MKKRVSVRCEHCGHGFRRRRDSMHSFGNNDSRVYHGPCMAYLTWRRTAEERLNVLRTVMEVAGLDERTITTVIELRATNDEERIATSNEAFRVFLDAARR